MRRAGRCQLSGRGSNPGYLMYLFSSAPGSQADIDGAYAWVRMTICLILGTVGSVGIWSIVVILPQVQEEFGVLRADASVPYTATTIGYAIGNFAFGRLADRHGTTRPLVFAGMLLGAGYLLSAGAQSIGMISILHGVMIGLGSSAVFAPLMVDVSRWFVRRRGIAVAVAASGNYLAGALWPLVMQPMLATGGWRFTYVVIGLICIAVIVPLAFTLRRPPPAELPACPGAAAGGGGTLPIGLTPRQLQMLLVAAGLSCCIAMSMPQTHLIAYCADLGYGPARGAEMLALMMVAGAVSRLVSGLLADKLGGVRTQLIGALGQLLGLMLFIPFDSLASLYVVSLLFGLSQGGIIPSYAIIIREYLPAREAGERVGLVIMATLFGMGFGGWINGFIYDLTGSYEAAFLHGIGWNLFNIAVMCVILFRTRRREALA